MKRAVLGLVLIGVGAFGMESGAGEVQLRKKADGTVLLVNQKGTSYSSRSVRPMRAGAEVEALIQEYSLKRGLDPKLVRAVVQVESAFDRRARSSKGAMGLMQLMPATAKDLGVENPWDAAQNVRGGTRYLRWMLDRFDGRLELALAGYNAGPGAVERYDGIPPYRETRNYVSKVMALYRSGSWRPRATKVARETRPSPQRDRPFVVTRDANNRILIVTKQD